MVQSETQEERTGSIDLRAVIGASGLIFAVAVLAACGGGESGGSPSATSSTAAASCAGINQLKSYRYSITVKLQSPAFGSAGQASPRPPLGAVADTIAALLSNLKIEGAYVAPDRTQAILKFQQDELELRDIGDRRWERLGTVWQAKSLTSSDIGFLTPPVVCQDIVEEIAPALARLDAREETVSGVASDHYTLGKADLTKLPQLLGTDPDTRLPDQFQVDIWLAKEERWPVRLNISAEDKDEQGNPTALALSMELRDINDPGISIETPPVASPTG